MTYKIFRLQNLTENDKILVTSIENQIDFSKENTRVSVYFNDFSKPEYILFAELYIYDQNQSQTSSFILPSRGTKATIVIEAITNYDVEKVEVLKK